MSFQITITPSKRAAGRLITAVRRALQMIYVSEQKRRGLKQTDIARKMGVHRSVVNKLLHGRENLTLGKVGELAWAMGRKAVISFPEVQVPQGANEILAGPQVSYSDSAGDVTIGPPQPRIEGSNSFSRRVIHA